MFTRLHTIFQVLNKKEGRLFCSFILFDFLMNILDIGFLGGLVYIVHFYTQTGIARPVSPLVIFFSAHAMLLTTLFFAGFGLKNFFAYLLVKKEYHFVYGVAARLSRDKMEEYFRSDFQTYVQVDSSVHVRNISQQPVEFGHYILRGWQQVFSGVLLVTGSLVLISIYDIRLLGLVLMTLLPAVALTGYLMKERAGRLRTTIRQAGEKSMQYLRESLAGLVESKIYSKSGFFTRRYARQQSAWNHLLATQQVIQVLPSRLMEVFGLMGLLVLILFRQAASLPVLTLGAFMAAAYKIIPGMASMLRGVSQIRAYDFVLNDLQVSQSKPDPFPSETLQVKQLEFKKVCFSFAEKEMLSGVSFSLEPGDFAGISGFSGKGKTTLLNLLLGFLQPRSGEILINGLSFSEISRESFWKRVSYVRQETFLIHDSAFQNVILREEGYGQEEGYDDEKFKTVAEQTGCKTFINGNATSMIRENGKNISGGQRQRLSLARALYKDFDLLILDEPFSEMDDAAEKDLLEQLRDLSRKGKMILFITHKASSLNYCNKILLLDES